MKSSFTSGLRFVVHEHQASHHHYDFRLEAGGVLKSWAVPKGPSMNPSDKRLAVMVDDHLLEYFAYEGRIPQGEYGAGAVVIWDTGTYQPLEAGDPLEPIKRGKLTFILNGKKLKGEFHLTLMKGKEKEWLLIKKKDEHADPNWKTASELTPERLKRLKVKVPPCASA